MSLQNRGHHNECVECYLLVSWSILRINLSNTWFPRTNNIYDFVQHLILVFRTSIPSWKYPHCLEEQLVLPSVVQHVQLQLIVEYLEELLVMSIPLLAPCTLWNPHRTVVPRRFHSSKMSNVLSCSVRSKFFHIRCNRRLQWCFRAFQYSSW